MKDLGMAEQENGTDAAPSSPFAVPQVSLPKGSDAIRGIGEKFAADTQSRAQALYRFPLPPAQAAPGEFGPQLSLSYDSASGNGPRSA